MRVTVSYSRQPCATELLLGQRMAPFHIQLKTKKGEAGNALECARADLKMTQKKRQVTKPIRLGLIGCGGIVRLNHISVYLALPESVSVVALADPVPDNLEYAGNTLEVPLAQRYADYRDMLAKAEIDAVSIATPHALHAEHAIQAAEAGVAVISEKPMATSLEEADAILDAVNRNGVPYAIMHNLLFTLPMQEALSQLRTGKVGKPILGRGQCMGMKPSDFGGDHANPAMAWRAQKAVGGGCIIDTAYHEIYSVEALMGSPVRYVEARVKTMHFDIDVDDLAIMLFEHEDGAVSTVSASWCSPAITPERGRWCEVHTSDGSIRVYHRDEEPFWHYNGEEGGWNSLDIPEATVKENPGVGGHFGCYAATFEALASGSEMPVTGEQGRHNLAIIEAARQATGERRAIGVE